MYPIQYFVPIGKLYQIVLGTYLFFALYDIFGAPQISSDCWPKLWQITEFVTCSDFLFEEVIVWCKYESDLVKLCFSMQMWSSRFTWCGICEPDPTGDLMVGRCHCKANVKGRRCDTCKTGFSDLYENNPEGCQRLYLYNILFTSKR